MPYLLDTNIVNAIRNGNKAVIERLKPVYQEAFINGIVIEEILIEGYLNRLNTIRSTGKGDIERTYADLIKAIADLSDFNQIPYTATAETRFKQMKLKAMDGRIAAHALELGYVVVTDNTKDFAKIPGLTLENWLEE